MKISRNSRRIAITIAFMMVFVQTFAYIGYANATSSSTATNEIEESFENGVLTLSGSGAIDSSAYKGRTDIQTLIINNGITSIGTSAFSGCTNLSSVTLANTVTAISNSAFYGCSGITEIELPPAIERLDDDCFGKTSIQEIFIPKTLQYCGSIFDQVPTFKKIVFEDGMSRIPNAICKDSTVETIVWPEGLTSIGSSSFSGCTKLMSIDIPDTVTEIGNGAFYGCSGITEIELPPAIERLDDDCFGKTNIQEIFIPKTLQYCSSEFDQVPTFKKIVFEDGRETIPGGICQNSTVDTIVWPEGLKSIGTSAFSGCTKLMSIDIPDSVTEIGNGAFYGCSQITEIELPPAIERLDDDCFGNTSIQEIFIPKTLKYCSSEFDQLPSLQKITFEDGMEKIPGGICQNSKVSEVNLPAGLKEISSSAFYNCTNLTSIDIPNTVTTIHSSAFQNDTDLIAYCGFKDIAVRELIKNNVKIMDNGKMFESTTDQYLLPSACSYMINSSTAGISGCIPFTVNYSIKDSWKSRVNNTKVQIFVPRNTELVESMIYVDGELSYNYTYNDNTRILSIPVTKSSGTVSCGVMMQYQDTLISYASLSAYKDGSSSEEIIGTINETYSGISITCDSQTSKNSITVSGIAPASANVDLYVDDAPIRTVKALKNGSWNAEINLPDEGDFHIYNIKAVTLVEEAEVSATRKVTYRKGAPAVTSLEVNYDEHHEIKKVDLLHNNGTKPIIYFMPGSKFIFKVGIENPENVDAVYVESTRNNITKELKATYDPTEGVFVTDGYFDENDHNYVPGKISVSYDKKNGTVTNDMIESTVETLVNDAKNKGATVTNKKTGTDEDGAEYTEANVDMSKVFGDLAFKDMKLGYKLFDQDTGYNVSEIFEMYDIAEDMIKVIYTADGDPLTVGYDFSDPKDVVAVISKGADYAGKISDAVYAIKLSDISWQSSEAFNKAFQQAEYWSNGTQAASYILDVAGIYIDHKDLTEKINNSTTITDKSKALREADELAHDQFMFLTVVTAMGILVAGSTMAGPALVAAALLGSMKILSDVFWQGRTNHALTGKFGLNWVVDPSGYIFDSDSLERIPDATVSAYWIPYDESAGFWDKAPGTNVYGTLWNAAEYEQQNPLLTNSDGKYAWDVPQGWWRVKSEKEGYQTTWSEWVPVPPIQTDVNIGMKIGANPEPEPQPVSISKASVKGIKNKVYTGKAITQGFVLVLNGTKLTRGADYTVTYKNNKNVGTATVTIKGIGDYTGSLKKTFVINPKGTTLSKLKSVKKGFTAKWKKQAVQTTGYEIQYSLKKNFKGAKIVKVTKASTVSKKFTKLKAKKKYFVRIRTYKTVGGKKYYSAWSKALSVKTKK